MSHWQQSNTALQKFPRVATTVAVRVTTVDPEIDPSTGKRFFRSAEETTANLSRGGAFIRSWEPLSAGRRILLTIDLPSGEELQLLGQVAWTQREMRLEAARPLEAPGYGIQFAEGSHDDLAVLADYLKTLEAKDASADLFESQPASPQP